MSTSSSLISTKDVRPDGALIVPFTAINRDALAVVGGKGANLGELVHHGFPVPPGFCVTTAGYELAVGEALAPVLAELSGTATSDTTRLQELAGMARAHVRSLPMPESLVGEIIRAYEGLGDDVPVAVRSSATAEDLAFASFAGQQDTYLNIAGQDAVLDAVRRCWASLWTDRAVSYRSSNGIDQRTVSLSVVVQRMVDAHVAGILFTADPLTGHRQHAVIDASPGLGEAVVSGAVNPDHWIIDAAASTILERRPGDKRIQIVPQAGGGTRRVEQSQADDSFCLSDQQVQDLTRLGKRVEAVYGAPQDIEWAIDGEGTIWLTQARPITTLFPLPIRLPPPEAGLHVYASINVIQGVYRPLTPMGIQVLRLVAGAMVMTGGITIDDVFAGPAPLHTVAMRLYVDVTGAVGTRFGRPLLQTALQNAEARMAVGLQHVLLEGGLAPAQVSPFGIARWVLTFLRRTRIPQNLLQALFQPAKAIERVAALEQTIRDLPIAVPTADLHPALHDAERVMLEILPQLIPGIGPLFGSGLLLLRVARRVLGELATPDELETIRRGLPHNPTTEMDLALWDLAQQMRHDPDAAAAISQRAPTELAAAYLQGTLPSALQHGLAQFLARYGHRSVAEIDIGLPRWNEDPTYLMGVLANYLRLNDPRQAPDVQFRRAIEEAEAMRTRLVERVLRRKGPGRALLVAYCLRQVRMVLGVREMPKYLAILTLFRIRGLLQGIGTELVRMERLAQADDIFFVSLPEVHQAMDGADLHALVRERRATYNHELKRRHIPGLLLSNGTEPSIPAAGDAATGALRGAPASGGVVTARARVILEPRGAALEPGEILVAPSTDPGWTPLFLTAGGLVMEMGGSISHGAVVAREYGIPAVVGVPHATERLQTGQWITVDGSTGTVSIVEPPNETPTT